jgi:hypothetical protein
VFGDFLRLAFWVVFFFVSSLFRLIFLSWKLVVYGVGEGGWGEYELTKQTPNNAVDKDGDFIKTTMKYYEYITLIQLLMKICLLILLLQLVLNCTNKFSFLNS